MIYNASGEKIETNQSASLHDMFRKKPLFHHLNQEEVCTIPAQSLYDIEYAKRLGFDVIEASEHECADGVLVCKHGMSGKIGYDIMSRDGVNYSETRFSDITSEELRSKVYYYSPYTKYQGAIPTLDEFAMHCRMYNLGIQVNTYAGVHVCRKYLQDNQIAVVAENSREPGFLGTVIRTWYTSSSIDACIAKCKEIGAPLQIAIEPGKLATLEESKIMELTKKAHDNGFVVSASYITPNDAMKAVKTGVDILCSTYVCVNDIETGNAHNICSLNDELLNLHDAVYDESSDTISMAQGDTITVDGSIKAGAVTVRIRYNGTLTIGGYDEDRRKLKSYESDGTGYVITSYVLQPGGPNDAYTKWVSIDADAATTIYEIDIKCSNIY